MLRAILIAVTFFTTPLAAQEPEPPMTLPRLGEIILALDPDAAASGTALQFTVAGEPIVVVADIRADRMRAMTHIRAVDGIEPGELARMMQANFDTALDARYAIAQGQLWSVFIHPLSPLEKNQFISAVGQIVNLKKTYGELYTGGALSYGGGDSQGLHRQLIDDLLKKGEPI